MHSLTLLSKRGGADNFLPPELKWGVDKIIDSGGTFSYQVTNFMQGGLCSGKKQFDDNFHNLIIFIVFLDHHWYVYYVNME